MKTYAEISQMKYELESPTLKEWAIKYGIVDLAYNIDRSPECYLENELVVRKNLSANDKAVV